MNTVDTMRFRRLLATAIAAVTLASAGVTITTSTAQAAAPLGYQLMCLRNPQAQECRGGGASSIAATNQVMDVLGRVNTHVNAAITPRHDGAADAWSVGATAGDCEDYVLAKRSALIDAGLPASALRIAYVKIPSGEGHAVLVVKTGEGDFVLDNLNRSIRHLHQTGYRVVSMSGADPSNWD